MLRVDIEKYFREERERKEKQAAEKAADAGKSGALLKHLVPRHPLTLRAVGYFKRSKTKDYISCFLHIAADC